MSLIRFIITFLKCYKRVITYKLHLEWRRKIFVKNVKFFNKTFHQRFLGNFPYILDTI